MNLYVDDDSVRALLIQLLVSDGHDTVTTTNAGLAGADDAVHLRRAIKTGRVLLTHNYKDFNNLHELVMESGGHHPGILVVRRDNDRTKDLSPRGIVRALGNLIQAAVPVPDRLHILNHWR